MPTVFMVLVLLAIISPTAFFVTGQRLIAVLYPLAEQGLVLAIMIGGIIFLLKGFK